MRLTGEEKNREQLPEDLCHTFVLAKENIVLLDRRYVLEKENGEHCVLALQ